MPETQELSLPETTRQYPRQNFRKYPIGVSRKLIPKLEEHALQILRFDQRTRVVRSLYAWKMGRHLLAVNTLLANHGNGGFGKWVEKRLQLSRKTAERYISVYTFFEKDCDIVTQFDVSALYVLASPSVDNQVRKEALALARSGHTISQSRAKHLIECEHRAHLEKFRKENSELLEASVDKVEMPALDAKARKSPLDRLKAAWEDASPGERQEFNAWKSSRLTQSKGNAA